MTVIVVDGPEAAGKSTFIARRFPGVDVRRWGPVDSVDEYVKPFHEDRIADKLVIWDRSWASEVVYNQLMGRGRSPERVAEELEHFRVMRVMVVATSRTLEMRRNFRLTLGQTDDLPVDPGQELKSFLAWGETHGWALEWTDESDNYIYF